MAKKRIEYIAGVETYQELSSFKSVEELNQAVQLHLDSLDLTKTETEVLRLLARYSCVYPGVSFLCKSKIAEMIGKSRRTVIRICLKLEQLGAIRQYEMKRTTDMKQTSNAIVIQFIQKEKLVQSKAIILPLKKNLSHKRCLKMSHQKAAFLLSKKIKN